MSLQALHSILQRPIWSKDVAVWIGSRGPLDEALQGFRQVLLDVLDLLPEDEKLPAARDDRVELLREQLDQQVRRLRPEGEEPTVLRVRNAALLARYGVGLRSFFDRFAGSRTMTVLEIDPVKPVTLPATVADTLRLDAGSLVNYFKPLLFRPDNLCVETK